MNYYDFYVIGIGASAGGLDPLVKVVSSIPAGTNAAVILNQHLPAGTPSNLGKLVERNTKMKVVVVETIEYIEPGNLYVMASGMQYKLDGRFLQVEDRNVSDKINHTIDTLFFSLAKVVADKSVGVILSGTGTDGLQGAKAIEDQKGLVIVQDPITAEFPSLPKTLIANDHPDYVLNPDEIKKKICEYAGVRPSNS
ncbi:chemotaxis protein CheB [Mucilaginibacter sp. 21P]|uniref:chemotaxis protein CheB n=1 Tax=Mucilaginibacter sp. 21P TaxID=2778902 RepID=UPI001C587750|nr:chemotaxis protein CheB [Mucilaginibacter sp. 21P]QXV67206.1 chemotaxis protein CheB [Mucilaginibacter sp. 21P]